MWCRGVGGWSANLGASGANFACSVGVLLVEV